LWRELWRINLLWLWMERLQKRLSLRLRLRLLLLRRQPATTRRSLCLLGNYWRRHLWLLA